MFCSVSLSGCLDRSPWTLRRFDHIVVCSKKGPPNNGFPGRRRRPRKKYSKDVEDAIDISLLYEANSVTEIPRGFVVDCNKRINECIEEGNLEEAQKIFDLMIKKELDPDVVTYSTLMKGYSRAGDSKRVFGLFKDMDKKRVRPTGRTFNTVIDTCAIIADLTKALYLFDRMKNRYWIKPDVFTYSSVLKVCASAKDLETAKEIIEGMHFSNTRCDVVTLSTMLDVYAECCNRGNARQYLKECRELLEEMKLKGVKANVHTFNTLLKLCARGSLTTEAMDFLNEMTIKNVHPNHVSYSTVIDGISKDEKLSDEEVLALSNEIVDRMKQEDILLNAHTYNNLMNIALRVENLSRAIDLFNEMKRLDIKSTAVTYGTMIKCYEKMGDPSAGDAYLKPCLDLLEECERYGIKMDAQGYVSLLSACANASNLDIALKTWKEIDIKRVERTVSMYAAMLNVYVSVEDLSGAVNLFTEMKSLGIRPNAITYNTMIKCYEKLGDPASGDAYLKPCLDLWGECALSGNEMSLEGYTSLLSACANAANLDTALEIWSRIMEAKIKPNVFAYSAMINVCLSVDKIDKAFDFFGEMKTSGVEPNEVTYTTIITHLTKKKDRSEAKKILDEMKTLGMQPDKNTLRRLKALELD